MTDGIRHFEDFHPGETIALGTTEMTRDAILDFARFYDPQPMHVDEEAAKASLLGSLSASGWHTASATMRLLCDHLLSASTSLGSPGIETLRWTKPVKPGDRLTARTEVLDVRASKSRPEIGLVRFRFTVDNQHGDTVMTMQCPIIFRRRGAA